MASANSPLAQGLRRFRRNRPAMVSLVLLVLVVLACILAPLIFHLDENAQDLSRILQPPSAAHVFGTDHLGRDILVRTLYGGRISLLVGVVATGVSLLIGVGWGAVAGYKGGLTDQAMMRFVDILYTLPYMFFVIVLVAVVGRELITLFIAIGAVSWLTMSRIVRGQVLSLKAKEFVEGARAAGAGWGRILLLHILPNTLGPIIVYSTLTVPAVMLEEAFLSFLGLGVQPPHASWGSLAAEGAQYLNSINIAWWMVLFPGAALTLTLFALNFIGDGLRDAFDPRLDHGR